MKALTNVLLKQAAHRARHDVRTKAESLRAMPVAQIGPKEVAPVLTQTYPNSKTLASGPLWLSIGSS